MKIVTAQSILRRLHGAGLAVPLAAGAGIVAASNGVKSSIRNSHAHQAGFNPNYVPEGHH